MGTTHGNGQIDLFSIFESVFGNIFESPLRGADYKPPRDEKRLTTQLQRVRELASDEHWRTIKRLCAELTRKYPGAVFPENSVQAQLRNLRKCGDTVERRYCGSGTYQYRLVLKC